MQDLPESDQSKSLWKSGNTPKMMCTPKEKKPNLPNAFNMVLRNRKKISKPKANQKPKEKKLKLRSETHMVLRSKNRISKYTSGI